MGEAPDLCIDHLDKTAGILIFHVLFILIIVLGTFGNIVAIMVWLTGETSKNSKCSVYLLFLSIADFCVVFLAGTMTYMAESWKLSLIDMSSVVCITYVVIAYSLQQISAWLTVAVTIQRTLAVLFPFRFVGNVSNSSKIAYITVIVITMCSVLPNMPRAFAYTVVQFDNVTFCVFADKAKARMIDTLQLVLHTFMTSLVPLVLITTFNIILLVKLASSRFQTDVHRDRSRSITKLVIAIGVVYSVSTFPWACHLLIERGWIDVDYETSLMVFCVSMVPVYINNALNPWLYCLFGKGFRSDVKLMIGAWKQRLCCTTIVMEGDSRNLDTEMVSDAGYTETLTKM